jgi:hypothetical protein
MNDNMGGRFGKYGDIKRKARIRANKPSQKKVVNPKKAGRRTRRPTKKSKTD